MTTLTLQGIECRYDTMLALEKLDLTVQSGELFSLLGPSGCGKTTLLRTVAGFVQPSAGRLLFDGEDVTDLPPNARNIGMVFQDYALFPDRTVFDNVAFGLRVRKADASTIQSKVGAVLERMGLSGMAVRRPAALSGGQRQRVAMARALVIEPRILLLDEPLSALDAKLRLELRQTIRDVQQEFNITTLFVTHDQDEALAISDRIALLTRGRIEQMGSPQQVYDDPKSIFAADFLGGANLLPVEQPILVAPGRIRYTLADCEFESRSEDDSPPTEHWRLCVRPHDWTLRQATQSAQSGTLRGKVLSSEFSGSHATYFIDLAIGTPIKAIAPRGHGEDLHVPGTEVELALPSSAVLLPGERTCA